MDGVVARYSQRCGCRKPRPGLVHRAARELDLDLGRSFVVSDRWQDVELGQLAGAGGILVKTGLGAAEARSLQPGVRANTIVEHLGAAARWLLEH